jgi:FkbH-like protein
LDFIETAKLDRVLGTFGEALKPYLNRARPVRLALIGSSTLAHLVPAIRVAALRRGIWVDVFEGHYGMYHQELADAGSDLHAFKPEVVLLALDAHHLTAGDSPSTEAALGLIQSCWRMIKEQLGATVIQQTILPVMPQVFGDNEHQFASSPASVIAAVNAQLRPLAKSAGVHLLAVDVLTEAFGIKAMFDPGLWYRSKQEIHPLASVIWGDHVGRLLAALRGLSYKCLVLDLDNTVWGGVIGDDGIEGIALGQGNAVGESYVAFQRFAAKLASRGVILAVCSKNTDSVARAAFEKHPDMILRLKDIACFMANWEDKATNLRRISETLNIGLDSLVFADDNPFERNLIRQELPMVAVPELPEDPALYAYAISDGGYFEGLTLTGDDLERGKQYQANAEREQLRGGVTDMASYLRGLDMQLTWLPFDQVGLPRVAQLINKSNQYNLTTRRYTEEEVSELMADSDSLTFQFRLVDRFGDNGMISVVIGRVRDGGALDIDTWLMSCRVLGRQVQEAALNVLVEQAKERGMRLLQGSYLPTAKNGMVKEHYKDLGFTPKELSEDGSSVWTLDLTTYEPKSTFIKVLAGNS